MDITRYDGSRFITEEEIDREFTGMWALIRIADDLDRDGYLVATGMDRAGVRSLLSDIAIVEFDAQAKVIFGCEARGGNLHVELLD